MFTHCTLCFPDCKPHRRDRTLPHHKHYFWLRPLLLGQKYSKETPELPGNLRTVLRLWAAGCWICLHIYFCFFLNELQLWMQCKSPTVAGSSCVQPTGWTGLSEWRGPATETRAGCCGDEPCRSGDHPESLENFTWFKKQTKKKWESCDLVALNECAYCYHVCFLIFVVHCDKCMVNIALQHCKSYLLNLICRCVFVFIWNGKKNKKKKKQKGGMRLCWSTSQQAYLWIRVTFEHYFDSPYVIDLKWNCQTV